MKLLMIGGENRISQNMSGPQYEMLKYFSTYWDRIDILSVGVPGAIERQIYGNVYLHPIFAPKYCYPIKVRAEGQKLAALYKHDLIVAHDFGFFYTGLGAYLLSHRTGIPYVSEIHHIEGYPLWSGYKEWLYRSVARIYIPWMSKRAVALRVVNHQEIPDYLVRLGIPQEKILVLLSVYLDFNVFKPIPDVQKKYDLLFVGRLTTNKGLFSLIDGLAKIKDQYPKIKLGIRGDGPLLKTIVARIDRLQLSNNVEFIPRLNDPSEMANVYNQARILVCASTSEGGPRVTLEAMACGVPVISTPVGLMSELIEDEQNGLLFRWTAAEFSDKATILLGDTELQHVMGRRGFETVQPFQAERVIGQYAKGYHNLIEKLQ